MLSNLARLSVMFRCLGPCSLAVINGRLTVVSLRGRQLALGLFSRFLEALQGHGVVAQVDGLEFLELVGQVVDQLLIPVITPQVGVAVGGEHLEDAVADVEDGDVKRAAPEVEHSNLFVGLLVQGHRRGRPRWAR